MKQLDREGVAYDVVDIEHDPAAADYVMSVNGGNQTVPTVVFPDGTRADQPQPRPGQGAARRLSRPRATRDLCLTRPRTGIPGDRLALAPCPHDQRVPP